MFQKLLGGKKTAKGLHLQLVGFVSYLRLGPDGKQVHNQCSEIYAVDIWHKTENKQRKIHYCKNGTIIPQYPSQPCASSPWVLQHLGKKKKKRMSRDDFHKTITGNAGSMLFCILIFDKHIKKEMLTGFSCFNLPIIYSFFLFFFFFFFTLTTLAPTPRTKCAGMYQYSYIKVKQHPQNNKNRNATKQFIKRKGKFDSFQQHEGATN